MHNKKFHLLANFFIERMLNWRKTHLADFASRKHVIQDLDTSDLLTLLIVDNAIKMAVLYKSFAYRLFV
jgi:hypothetical protein